MKNMAVVFKDRGKIMLCCHDVDIIGLRLPRGHIGPVTFKTYIMSECVY